MGAYTASKGAIVSYTKTLAVELAPYGVLVNAMVILMAGPIVDRFVKDQGPARAA